MRGPDGFLRVEIADTGREYVLDPLAGFVWDLCDGSRTIQALADAAGQAFHRAVTREEVFSALDFLADAGLMEERAAPPVAEIDLSRRGLLGRIAPALSVAASMAIRPPSAKADEAGRKEDSSKESRTKDNRREDNAKEQRTKDNRKEDIAKDNRREDNAKEQRRKNNN